MDVSPDKDRTESYDLKSLVSGAVPVAGGFCTALHKAEKNCLAGGIPFEAGLRQVRTEAVGAGLRMKKGAKPPSSRFASEIRQFPLIQRNQLMGRDFLLGGMGVSRPHCAVAVSPGGPGHLVAPGSIRIQRLFSSPCPVFADGRVPPPDHLRSTGLDGPYSPPSNMSGKVEMRFRYHSPFDICRVDGILTPRTVLARVPERLPAALIDTLWSWKPGSPGSPSTPGRLSTELHFPA